MTRPEGRREAGNWIEGGPIGRPAGKGVSHIISRERRAGNTCKHTSWSSSSFIVLLVGLYNTFVAMQAVGNVLGVSFRDEKGQSVAQVEG